jgi:hypothetical protein
MIDELKLRGGNQDRAFHDGDNEAIAHIDDCIAL